MKKLIIFTIIFILLISSVQALNWRVLFDEIDYPNRFDSQSLTVDLIDEGEIVNLINNNRDALKYINKAEIEQLTIKTEQRSIYLEYINGKVFIADRNGGYKIKTTEEDLNQILEKYQNGEMITLDEIRDRFKIPFGLYWKVVTNIW